MGAGLIGVWYADLRSRQVREMPLFAAAVRSIAVLYDGLVVPGALLLLGSGTWLIVMVYGGCAFLGMPWLIGMVALFAFEFIEGNTITRLYFMRLRRLTREAVQHGKVTQARAHLYALPRYSDAVRDRGAGGDTAEQVDSIRHWNGAGAPYRGDSYHRDPSPVPLRARGKAALMYMSSNFAVEQTAGSRSLARGCSPRRSLESTI